MLLFTSMENNMKLPTLDTFLQQYIEQNQPLRNVYVKEVGFQQLYVRIGRRYLNGMWVENVLDIANVDAKKTGRGFFTRLICRLQQDYPLPTLYVENVMTERFSGGLVRLGFTRHNTDEPPSYYLLPL